MMKDNSIRISIIASYIDGLLKEKHAAGYSYRSEEMVLNRFDTYCFNNKLDTLNITTEFLSGWMERTENEGAFNQGKRISCVKQLLLYGDLWNQSIYSSRFLPFHKGITSYL